MRNKVALSVHIRFDRRTLLRASLGGVATAAGAAVLAACGETAAPTATVAPPTARPTSAAPAASPATQPTAPVATAAPAATVATTTGAAPATASPTGTAAGASAVAPMATPATVPSGATAARAATASPATTTVEGKLPSPAPGVPDAYTKPPPVFRSSMGVPGRGGRVTTLEINFGMPPTPRDRNVYWRELEKRLGVSMLDATLAPAATYGERLAAVTASGDLPDLTYLDLTTSPDQNKIIQQGAWTDLTPYLTGDGLKEFPNLAAISERVWNNLKIRGKLYGVPRPRFIVSGSMMIRKDWMEKVGIPNPKNADEFFELMTRFTKGDPDGNGRQDTWALGAVSPRPHLNLRYFNQMWGVPNNWGRNPDGTLTHQIETDGYRQAITYARRLWDAGVYHPDALTMTDNAAKDFMNTGKIGAFDSGITTLPGRNGVRLKSKEYTPAAEVIGLPPMGYDGGKAVYYNGRGFLGFMAIPAKVGRDRERVRELLRIVNYLAAPFGSEEDIFISSGLEGVHHTVQPDGTRVATDQGRADLAGLAGGIANAPIDLYYPDKPDDGPFMQSLIKDLLALGIDDPTTPLYSPTNVTAGGTLGQLITDRQIVLITGREPLSALDQFVKDWRSRGGDAIRKEFEAELKA